MIDFSHTHLCCTHAVHSWADAADDTDWWDLPSPLLAVWPNWEAQKLRECTERRRELLACQRSMGDLRSSAAL